ncbi:hypothetical protein JCM19233_3071 [Vibrio astriarenae]|nr:hypothetical protein JCM19233_3071 [Vibrio sp. C7]
MFIWPTRRDLVGPEEFGDYFGDIYCNTSDYKKLMLILEQNLEYVRFIKDVDKEKHLYDYID